MTVPTPEQLTRLRQRPHRTKLSLAVYQPNTVLAAQINMPAIAKGEREISIDVLAGDVWSVARGMTCYIGETPNSRYRRLRAIGCTPTTITLAENDINWVDGLYLTVVNFFEPWAVFPRITLNDDNVPSFYKDYDIVYTNQNEVFDPVVNMGPHAATFLNTTPSGTFARIWYNSSGTYDPTDDSIPTGYAWSFEGGYPTATFGPDPGYIEYTGGGHFLTSLTVTSNQGKTFTGRRHIMVLNQLGEGDYAPISHWGFSSMEGSRDQGGYSIRLWLREEADFVKVADGALVVIFSDDSEGVFEGKAGGNAENRSETFFVGYIETDSISINSFSNRLEFRAESITGALKKIATFSATLEDVDDAATWNEMTKLTVDKSLVHYLRWHTTVLSICDYAPMGSGVPVEYIDFERGNIYDAVNNIAASTMIGIVCADRQGKVWTEIDANVLPTGSSRGLNTVMELTRQDWRGNLDIRVVHDDVLSYLEMGGIAYSGAETGTSDAFLAGAPGDAPSYWGALERVSGLVLESQVQLNELVGLAWARANADFPTLTIPVAGDYRVFDLAPQERLLVTLEPEDNYRGFTWDLKPFIPHAIRYSYNSAQQSLLMEMEAREETDGPPGETVEIPVDPPFDTFDLPAWELPPFTLPPLPVIPPLEPPPTTGGTVYVVYQTVIGRSRNFFSDSPTWEKAMDVSLVSGIDAINGMVLDPADPINSALIWGTNGSTNPCILKTSNLDAATPTWTLTFGPTEANTFLGGSGVTNRSIQHVKPWINGRLWTAAGQGALNCGVGINCPKFVRSYDGGASWTDEYHNGTEGVTYGSPMVIQPTSFGGGTVYAGGQFRLWQSIDAGVNWTQRQSNPPGFYVPVEMPHPGGSSGQIVYVVRSVSFVPDRRRLAVSVDGGVTFTNIPLTYDGYDDWAPYVVSTVKGNLCENFTIHPVSGVGYAMLISQQVSYSLFAALSTTWVPLFRFNDVVFPYAVHESDDNYHYALGPGGTTPRILGSNDGGVTWVSKTGNFESAVKSFATAGARTSINPVGVI